MNAYGRDSNQTKKARSIQQKARLPNDRTQGTEMTPDLKSGVISLLPTPWAGDEKEGRKNPPQHIYHITPPSASQRRIGPGSAKSVLCTKADVCIWETFHLEKLEFPWYSIGTKRRYLNSKSSGGLPKANGNNGNQSDFKSK